MELKKVFWGLRAILYKLSCMKIGKKCYIGKPVFLKKKNNIRIDNRSRIFPHSRMECLCGGKIIIGSNCTIGQNFHIISYTKDLAIGKNCIISANVFISNVNHSYLFGKENEFINELDYYETSIGDNVFIGYGACILPGSKIGNNCVIGANSVVKGIYDDFSMIAGNPARIIKKYNLNLRKWENVI